MSLIADFKTRFTEFDDAVVDQYIPILEPVWPCYYGGAYTGCGVEIILNLIAHLLVIETSAGSANVKSIDSKSVGSVSLTYSGGYASTSENDAWFKSTKYGSRYLMLTSSNIGAFFV